VLLAHAGSFVPAERAEIGLVDRIFTRIGASDDLSRGESTFMVEMRETARILDGVTDRTLVVLDEVGRGTSTYDGLSIAWAVAEHLHDSPVRPKVLFATHFHELTDIVSTCANARNFHVAVRSGRGRSSSCGGSTRGARASRTESRWRGWPVCRPPWWTGPGIFEKPRIRRV